MTTDTLLLSTPVETPRILYRIAGQSLVDIVESIEGLDQDRFIREGVVTSDGQVVPPEWWDEWVPQPQEIIRLHLVHAGGGGDGSGKDFLALLATVLLTVVVSAVSGGALAGVFGSSFAKGTLGASLASTAIGVVGQLAINALFPPQAPSNTDSSQPSAVNQASISGNALSKGSTIPRVVGTFTLAPPLIAQPRAYLSGDDIKVEAIYALAGPTTFNDIRVRGTSITDLEGVEYWVDEGAPESPRDNHFDRYASTLRIGTALGRHEMATGETDTSDSELRDQTTPENSLPTWHRFHSRRGATYVQVQLTMAGLYDPTESGALTSHIVWFRLRARKRGDVTWKKLVTIPYRSKTNNVLPREIRIFFDEAPLHNYSDPQRYNGFLEPGVPGAVTVDHVTVVPADGIPFNPDVTATPYLRREGVDFYIGDAYFQDSETDEYEFEIRRSEMVPEDTLTTVATMVHTSGDTRDYFEARLVSTLWATQSEVGKFSDTINLDFSASVLKAPPVPIDAALSTLHVRVTNLDLTDLTVEASGLVPQSPDFTTYGASSNPADIFRYLMTGPLSIDKVPVSELDSSTIAAWRAECISQGYEANGVVAGSIGEALSLVCAAGHAQYNEGHQYGIVYDRDTTSEPAIQHFTPINTRGLSWAKAFTKLPNALRVEFYDRARNHELNELEVSNPDSGGSYVTETEVIRYPLVDTEAQVTSRALLDLRQLSNSSRYTFDIGMEALAVTRGQVALLSSQFLHRAYAWARVTSILNATTFTVDRPDLPLSLSGSIFDAVNFFNVVDVFSEGVPSFVAVRLTGSADTQISEVTAYTSGVLTIDSTANLNQGDLCTFGPAGTSTQRVIVTEIRPKGSMEATIVCMEELV